MKSVIKEKFKNNVLVKPLYKLKNRNKIEPKMIISLDSTFELDGRGFIVKRNVVNHSGKVLKTKDFKRKRIFLCDECEKNNQVNYVERHQRRSTNKDGLRGHKMLGAIENIKTDNIKSSHVEDKTDKLVQADNNIVVLSEEACTWLRLYPLPKLPEESICSVIFRCIVCQLGLSTILVLWMCIWIFVIQSYEGPYEIQISLEFEKAQNQLVIDLATELRQITPLSPRWKAAIERRIEEARHITSAAVVRGAKPRPGQYWDLSGTFLFTVYVMTALAITFFFEVGQQVLFTGFGAPVPQTTYGRISALIYAILAVPTHFYLMCNLSTSIVVNAETYVNQMQRKLRDKRASVVGKNTLGNESPDCSRNSELLKTPSRAAIGRKVMRLLGVFSACRSVPLGGVLYYLAGACIFGVLRGLGSLETMMFPLEFTTSGQLEIIPGHIRIMYGFYVEGAMMLIACALTTLKRHSSASINRVSEKYRLFATAH